MEGVYVPIRKRTLKYFVEECHCNVETMDKYGFTPLHTASYNGHFDVVKYLVEECHCSVEAKDEDGRTPLQGASANGHLDIVKYFVEECHCNVEAKDNKGKTPLDLAYNEEIQAYLKSKQ